MLMKKEAGIFWQCDKISFLLEPFGFLWLGATATATATAAASQSDKVRQIEKYLLLNQDLILPQGNRLNRLSRLRWLQSLSADLHFRRTFIEADAREY